MAPSGDPSLCTALRWAAPSSTAHVTSSRTPSGSPSPITYSRSPPSARPSRHTPAFLCCFQSCMCVSGDEAADPRSAEGLEQSSTVPQSWSPNTHLSRLDKRLMQTQAVIRQMEVALRQRKRDGYSHAPGTPQGAPPPGDSLWLTLPSDRHNHAYTFPLLKRSNHKDEYKTFAECEEWLENSEAALVNHVFEVPGLVGLLQALTEPTTSTSPQIETITHSAPWLLSRRTLSTYSAVFTTLACIQGVLRELIRAQQQRRRLCSSEEGPPRASGERPHPIATPASPFEEQHLTAAEKLRYVERKEEHFLNDALALQQLMLRDDSNLLGDEEDVEGNVTEEAVEEGGECLVQESDDGGGTEPHFASGTGVEHRAAPHHDDLSLATGPTSVGRLGRATDGDGAATAHLSGDDNKPYPPMAPVRRKSSKLKTRHPAWTDTQLVLLSLNRGNSAAISGLMVVAANNFALIVKLLFKKCFVVEELVLTAIAMSEQRAKEEEVRRAKEKRGVPAFLGRRKSGATTEGCEFDESLTAQEAVMFDPAALAMMLPPGLDAEDYDEERSYLEHVRNAETTSSQSSMDKPRTADMHKEAYAWVLHALSKVSPDALPVSTLQANCHVDLFPRLRSQAVTPVSSSTRQQCSVADSLAFPTNATTIPTETRASVMPRLLTTHRDFAADAGVATENAGDELDDTEEDDEHTAEVYDTTGSRHHHPFSLSFLLASLLWNTSYTLWSDGYIEDAHRWLCSIDVQRLKTVIIKVEEMDARQQMLVTTRSFPTVPPAAVAPVEALSWAALLYNWRLPPEEDDEARAVPPNHPLASESPTAVHHWDAATPLVTSPTARTASGATRARPTVPNIILPLRDRSTTPLAFNQNVSFTVESSATDAVATPSGPTNDSMAYTNRNVSMADESRLHDIASPRVSAGNAAKDAPPGDAACPTSDDANNTASPRLQKHHLRERKVRSDLCGRARCGWRLLRRITALRDLCSILLACESTDDVFVLVRSLGQAQHLQATQLQALKVARTEAAQRPPSQWQLPPHGTEETRRRHPTQTRAWQAELVDPDDGIAELLIILSVIVEFFLAKRSRKLIDEHHIQRRQVLAARLLQGQPLQVGTQKSFATLHTKDLAGESDLDLENRMMREACDELVRAFTGGTVQSTEELDTCGMPTVQHPPGGGSSAGPSLASGVPPVLSANVLSCALNYTRLFRLSKVYHGVATTESRHLNETRCGESGLADELQRSGPLNPCGSFAASGGDGLRSAPVATATPSGGFFERVVGVFSSFANAPPDVTRPSGRRTDLSPYDDPLMGATGAPAVDKDGGTTATSSGGGCARLPIPSRRRCGGLPLLVEEDVCDIVVDATGTTTWMRATASSGADTGAAAAVDSLGTSSRAECSLRLLTITHRARRWDALEWIRPATLRTVTMELNKAIHLLQGEMRGRFGASWWASWKEQKEAAVHRFYANALAEVRFADLQCRPPLSEALPKSRLMSPLSTVMCPGAVPPMGAAATTAVVPPPSIPAPGQLPSAWWGQPITVTQRRPMHAEQRHLFSFDKEQEHAKPSPQDGDEVAVVWDAPPTFVPDVVVDFSQFTTSSVETQLATQKMVTRLMQKHSSGGKCQRIDSHTATLTSDDGTGAGGEDCGRGCDDDGVSLMPALARQLLHDELPILEQYCPWRIIYSTRLHGMSMQTLLTNCAHEHRTHLRTKSSTASRFAPQACPMILLVELMPSMGYCFACDDAGVRAAAAAVNPTDLSERPSATPNRLIIGSYLSDVLQMNSRRYYGTQDTFLFQVFIPGRRISRGAKKGEPGQAPKSTTGLAERSSMQRPAPLSSTMQEAALAQRMDGPQLRLYRASGANTQFINCRLSSIVVGGGGGAGLYIDDSLQRGATTACPTFASPPLTVWQTSNGATTEAASTPGTASETSSFVIKQLEVIVMDR